MNCEVEQHPTHIPIPQLASQVLDPTMPSSLTFESDSLNPEEISWSKGKEQLRMKQFSFRGKGIFDIEPKHSKGHALDGKAKGFIVKAYNHEGTGLKHLWESVIGYSKREIFVQDGQVYITEKTNKINIVEDSYKLTHLLKIFVDFDENSIRLVWRDQHLSNKRISKDYQCERLSSLVEKILLECNVIGLQSSQGDF